MKSLAAYNRWANDKIVAIADSLADDSLTAEAAHGSSILDTLAHTVGTQLFWLNNWTGLKSQYDFARAGLVEAFANSHERMDALVAATDEAGWTRVIEFSFPGTPTLRLPRWQTFGQVMYHGMQHRAQVAEGLTRLGHSPGDLNYIIWLLVHGGA
jgi:uncharacterized damage-inducible protein DinB